MILNNLGNFAGWMIMMLWPQLKTGCIISDKILSTLCTPADRPPFLKVKLRQTFR